MEFFSWMDYAVILIFVLFAVVVVGTFVDQAPKKWLMIIGVIATGGLALLFTYKKKRIIESKLDAHNNEIKQLLDLVGRRDTLIQQNNQEIAALSRQRDELSQGAAADKEKIAVINHRIAKRLETAHTINAQIKAQETVLNTHLNDRQAERPLKSATEILSRYGLIGQRAVTRPKVSDPNPPAVDDKHISVDGFSMKGDV